MQVFVADFYAQIMEEIEKYSEYDLEQLSYRILQQVAKSMSLPSNVKKIYLVQMIYAKTHCTAEELESIIQRVRYERQLLTQNTSHTKRKGKKKMRLQATEVSSTNSASMSPPIDLTPKRAYSPEMLNIRSVVKYGPRAALSPKNTSDRVLRSSNMKSYKRPNYSMINNSVVELVKSERNSPKEKEAQISIVSQEGRLPRLNVTARCVVRQLKPAHSPRSYLRRENTVASVNTHTQTSSSLVPVKRARTLSGIYPIPRPEPPLNANYEYIHSIGFRRTDGKISKINALVQKPVPRITYGTQDSTDSYKNVEVTIQDIINSNIDSQTFTNPSVSECMLTGSSVGRVHMPLSDVMPAQRMNFSVYYHKKIRAEEVRTNRGVAPWAGAARGVAGGRGRTYCTFSKAPRDVTRPIYVQVGGEEERITSGSLVPTLQKVSIVNRPPRSELHSDAARDVTKAACTLASEELKIPSPRNMSTEQRLSDSEVFRDVTHTQPTAEEKTTSPSLIDNLAEGQRLPNATSDVTHTVKYTPGLVEYNSQSPGAGRSLPALSDVFGGVPRDVTRGTPQPVSAEDKSDQRLPKFSEVFSEAARDVTRPVYRQLRDEESTIEAIESTSPPVIPHKMANESRAPVISAVQSKLRDPRRRPLHAACPAGELPILETVYTLKRPQPPPPPAPGDTSCVYCTGTVSTAAQLPLVPVAPLPLHNTSLEPASRYAATTSDEVSRLCDFPFAEQDMTLRRYREAASRSESSTGSRAATVSDMVEDALEIISQDGDYMERIGMDVRMQCILCSWAGSKIILEYHIRKEHSTQITQQDKSEWNVTYKLGSLVNQDLWLSHVCERDSTLYILSVKYEDPDCFMASLNTLSIADTEPKFGTLTLYNKVTGEPFSWHGQVPPLPSNMPYENDPNCLRIELSKLELLPNSANLKLLNRELVLNSPSKVVVGQPELNDIHIIIFVEIHDV